MADWYLYVIETDGQRLYTGITTDVERRFAEHQTGKGARFMRGRKCFTLRHQQRIGSRSLASKAEYAFKQLKRSDKLFWLAQGEIPFHPETGKLSITAAATTTPNHKRTSSEKHRKLLSPGSGMKTAE